MSAWLAKYCSILTVDCCLSLQNMDNIVMQEVDNSNGVIFPFVDHDTNMVYLCGKVSAPATFVSRV